MEVVPFIFGALSTVPEQIIKNFELLKLTTVNVHLIQKSVILRTATILRRDISSSQILVELEHCLL